MPYNCGIWETEVNKLHNRRILYFYGLFNDVVGCSDYIMLNVWMMRALLIKRKCKNVVIAYFEVLIRYFSGGNEENYENVFKVGQPLL
jgi:hypothetical protein